MDQKKIGDFIRSSRLEKELTQVQLAERLHVSDKAVSKWERGLCCPDIDILLPIANELGVSVIELLSGGESDNGETDNDGVLIDTASAYVAKEKKRNIVISAIFCLIILAMIFLMPASTDENIKFVSYTLPEGLEYVTIPLTLESSNTKQPFEINVNALIKTMEDRSREIVFTEVFNCRTGMPLVMGGYVKLFLREEKIEIFVNGMLSDIDYSPGIIEIKQDYAPYEGYLINIIYDGMGGNKGLFYRGKEVGGYVSFHGWHTLEDSDIKKS